MKPEQAHALGGQSVTGPSYRVYGKYRNFEDFPDATRPPRHDGWQDVRGGFRLNRYRATIR